ncbi:hypothetical protein EYF80_001713 [Liparis tanakae]|uniref:Uncharacterized protein n=1 Tax=Liparis tanakae TaxID=230148 RepID=A0A4Z2JFT8_9TELE|nr:hypothetical protein EYF80_001713 [Liparis tanakae]
MVVAVDVGRWFLLEAFFSRIQGYSGGKEAVGSELHPSGLCLGRPCRGWLPGFKLGMFILLSPFQSSPLSYKMCFLRMADAHYYREGDQHRNLQKGQCDIFINMDVPTQMRGGEKATRDFSSRRIKRRREKNKL